MFFIITKDNCKSCIEATEFMQLQGVIYKEINCSRCYLNDDQIKLMGSISNNQLNVFVREKCEYFKERGYTFNSLTELQLKELIKVNFKKIGSFPVIIQLDYLGKAKNCLIGFNESILKSWIKDETIENTFSNVNGLYGDDACCWLDKKDDIISTFKKDIIEKKTPPLQTIKKPITNTKNESSPNKSIEHLKDLKKKSNDLAKKADLQSSPEDQISLLKKYENARQHIIDNDKKMKRSYDFFSMDAKNDSFIEQLQKERDGLLNQPHEEDEDFIIDTSLINDDVNDEIIEAQEHYEEPSENYYEDNNIEEHSEIEEEFSNEEESQIEVPEEIELKKQENFQPKRWTEKPKEDQVEEERYIDFEIYEEVKHIDEYPNISTNSDFIPIISDNIQRNEEDNELDYKIIDTVSYEEEIDVNTYFDDQSLTNKPKLDPFNDKGVVYLRKQDVEVSEPIIEPIVLSSNDDTHQNLNSNEENDDFINLNLGDYEENYLAQEDTLKEHYNEPSNPIMTETPENEHDDSEFIIPQQPVQEDVFISPNDAKELDEVKPSYIDEQNADEQAEDDSYIDVSLGDYDEFNHTNESVLSSMNSSDSMPIISNEINKTTPGGFGDDWVDKYRLNESELSHQKGIEKNE